MRIQLQSDFIDYYDHAFDLTGLCWERLSRTAVDRQEAISRLSHMGLQVPFHGSVETLAARVPNSELVVYTDPYAHRSEGKVKLPAKKAWEHYKHHFATVYIKAFQGITHLCHSYRYLRIGYQKFFLLYESDDEWRSNCGDVEITAVAPPLMLADFEDKEPYPMLAIDFVVSEHGLWAAIDYNTSPGLRWTPVEEDIKPKRVYDFVREWFREERRCNKDHGKANERHYKGI